MGFGLSAVTRLPFIKPARFLPLTARCEGSLLATYQGTLRIKKAEKLDRLGQESGPAGLMACTEPPGLLDVD